MVMEHIWLRIFFQIIDGPGPYGPGANDPGPYVEAKIAKKKSMPTCLYNLHNLSIPQNCQKYIHCTSLLKPQNGSKIGGYGRLGSGVASPLCQEGQGEGTFPIFAFSSWFFLFHRFFPPFPIFPDFPLFFLIFGNFLLSGGGTLPPPAMLLGLGSKNPLFGSKRCKTLCSTTTLPPQKKINPGHGLGRSQKPLWPQPLLQI